MESNERPLLAGYQVEATNQLKSNNYKPQTYYNGYLLTARQLAFQSAEQLLTQKGDNEALALTISLVEIDRSQIPNATKVIASVFEQPLTQIQPAINWAGLELTEVERSYYQANNQLTKLGAGW